MKTNRRNFIKSTMGMLGASTICSSLACNPIKNKTNKVKNVLFIIVEDLKNVMACYGYHYTASTKAKYEVIHQGNL